MTLPHIVEHNEMYPSRNDQPERRVHPIPHSSQSSTEPQLPSTQLPSRQDEGWGWWVVVSMPPNGRLSCFEVNIYIPTRDSWPFLRMDLLALFRDALFPGSLQRFSTCLIFITSMFAFTLRFFIFFWCSSLRF